MKVRFRTPEERDPLRDCGIRVPMAPAKRPDIPRWRWYMLIGLVTLPLLWMMGRFFAELMSLKGSGYINYPQLELRAPSGGRIEEVLVEEGQQLAAVEPLLRFHSREGGRVELIPAKPSPAAAAGSREEDGQGMAETPIQVERVWITPGEYVAADSLLLTLRTDPNPVVHAWMDSSYLERLRPGRPATVQLPDGAERPATVARVALSTEAPPDELRDVLAGRRSSLLVVLRLNQPLAESQRINHLPVEVRLNWLDEYPRLRTGISRMKLALAGILSPNNRNEVDVRPLTGERVQTSR